MKKLGRRPRPLVDRFWPKVNRLGADQCWLWVAKRMPWGYGVIDRGRLAHRVSYELSVGPIPPGMCVCHRCDNPPCVNPAHLFLGTPRDNTADMDAKGRRPRGEHYKLSASDVAEIKRSSETQVALADRFGVRQQTISAVRRG